MYSSRSGSGLNDATSVSACVMGSEQAVISDSMVRSNSVLNIRFPRIGLWLMEG